MADDYGDIYQTAMAGYRTAIAEAQLDFQRAEASYDFASRVQAAQRIAGVRAEMTEFDRMSHEHAAALRPPAPAQRGEIDLTPDEAARICGVDASTYNAGVARLQHLKAKGLYKE